MSASRTAPGILTACSEPWQRWLWPLLYLPFALFSLIAVLADDADTGKYGHVVVMLLAIATGMLWFGWFSRTLLLRLDAGAELTPGLGPAIARALAGVFAATVLLPGCVLAFAGIEPAFALGALTAAAMAGLLVAWLPGMAMAALGVLPLLLSVLHDFVPQLPVLQLLTPVSPAHWLLPGCGLALLAWWRWRVLARASTAGRTSSRWLRPVLLVPTISRRRDEDGRPRSAASVHVLPWLYPRRIAAGVGPDKPVRALRIWLGAPFAPLAMRYWLFQAGLFALVPLILLNIGLTAAMKPIILSAPIVGWLIGWFVEPITRLDHLQRTTNGEMGELALLPGLGGSAALRGRLLRIVFGTRAWGLLLCLLALYVALAVQGAGFGRYALGTLIVVAVTATGTWLVLRSLAGRPFPKPGSVLLLLMGLGLLLPGVFTLFHLPATIPPWQPVAWSTMLVVAGIGTARAWRCFHARPHPFLQE